MRYRKTGFDCRVLGLVLLVVTAMVPMLASAAPDRDEAFARADFDGDGKVSIEEFRNRVMRVFGHADHNSDGRIAGNEHAKAVTADGKLAQPGNVTAEAFQTALDEAFQAADKDKDGSLSPDEWSAAGR